ncbi:hypothetical protein Bca101_059581 [Brassica carinata]
MQPALAFILFELFDLSLESGKMNNCSKLPLFPSSFVGGRARLCPLPADPFSSPIPAWAEILEADREAVPMAPLKHHRSYLLDDGPRFEIREEDLMEIRRKYGITPSVGRRCSSEYERVPDGGDNEVAVFEANLEAGFRVIIPSLVAAVSLYFGFCTSQLTPLTWRTLMAIQVLGEFHGFSIGVHKVLYLYFFAPSVSKPGFHHLFSRGGAPLVDEPSRGLRGNFLPSPFCILEISVALDLPSLLDVSRLVSVSEEAVVKLAMEIPRSFQGVAFLTSKETLRHSRVWGNVVRLSV